jgi:uncharacterized protein (DUF111 family)
MTDGSDMPDPPDNQKEAAGSSGSDHDYRMIEWDEGTPLSEWHYTHRRAWILQNELLERGHPDLVNWSELARRFDKSKSTLHRDKEVLTEFLTDDLDDDRIDLIGQTIFEKGLRDLLTPTEEKKMKPDGTIEVIEKPPNYTGAAKFYRMWVDTLARRGRTEWKDPDKREDSEAVVEGGLRQVAVEVAGVAPEELDDLDDMPDRDKPPELVDGATEVEES